MQKELSWKGCDDKCFNSKSFSGKKIFEWKEQIENQNLLVRDIIDIDSTYEDFESSDDSDDLKINKKSKEKKLDEDKKEKSKNPVVTMTSLMCL